MSDWLKAGDGHAAFIKAADGSYLQAAHITRLFLQEDVTAPASVAVKASIPGPGHPFTIAVYSERAVAEEALAKLVLALEG